MCGCKQGAAGWGASTVRGGAHTRGGGVRQAGTQTGIRGKGCQGKKRRRAEALWVRAVGGRRASAGFRARRGGSLQGQGFPSEGGEAQQRSKPRTVGRGAWGTRLRWVGAVRWLALDLERAARGGRCERGIRDRAKRIWRRGTQWGCGSLPGGRLLGRGAEWTAHAVGGGCGVAKGVWAKPKSSGKAQSSHTLQKGGIGHDRGERQGTVAVPGRRGAGAAARLQRRACCAAGARANKITQAWINTGCGRGCSRRGGGGAARRRLPSVRRARQGAPAAAPVASGVLVGANAHPPASGSGGQYSRGSRRRRRRRAPKCFWGYYSAAGVAAAAVHGAELQLQLAGAGEVGDDL